MLSTAREPISRCRCRRRASPDRRRTRPLPKPAGWRGRSLCCGPGRRFLAASFDSAVGAAFSSAASVNAGAPAVNAAVTSNNAIFNNLFTAFISFIRTKNGDFLNQIVTVGRGNSLFLERSNADEPPSR